MAMHELFEKIACKSIFHFRYKVQKGHRWQPPKVDLSVSYAFKKQNSFLLSSNVLDISLSLHT
jgi:hypothetical protein